MKKTWLERGRDYDLEFSEWDDLKFTFGLPVCVALLLAGIGDFLLSALKFVG